MTAGAGARTFGVWLTTTDLVDFLPCASPEAGRQWCKRHGIIRRGNGTVLRRDIEEELARMARARHQTKRGTHPNSLKNLRGAKEKDVCVS